MPRIFIVEDAAIYVTLLQTQLSKLDYEIAGIASNGENAIDMVKNQNMDLILMDISLSGKINGLKAAETILKFKKIPIIFLTSHAEEEIIGQASSLAPFGYLIKPVKIFELKAAIDIALSRAAIETRLFKSESRYKAIVEDQTELICRYLPDKTITFVNDAFCQYYGKQKEDLIGQTFNSTETKKNLPTDPDKPVITSELCLEQSDGNKKWYQWTDRAIFDEKGILFEYQSVGLDITKLKQAENELRFHRNHLQELVEEQTADLRKTKDEAERANRAKSEFLANISHELRTPMHQILNFSQFGISKIDSAPREKFLEYFSKINSSGKRLTLFLNDLLDLSLMESGKMNYQMSRNDVLSIIKQITLEFETNAKDKRIQLKIAQPEISTEIVCDTVRISQLMRAIISNGIKFTPRGSNITISFHREEIKSDKSVNSALRIVVTDQGIGIPKNELDSIFTKFNQSSRTKTGAGGTGLGLALCNEIVKSHHGRIKAENNPEGGARISIILPYIQDYNS